MTARDAGRAEAGRYAAVMDNSRRQPSSPGGGASRSGGRASASRTGKRGEPGGRGAAEPPDERQRLERPLAKVLERLPATQREVLEWRMGLKDGHPHNLADTAEQMGLSMSEARDIEKRAFEHIREAVPVQHLQKFLQA